MVDAQQQRIENLGPAERIIQTLVGFTDHMVHNRPGMVEASPMSPLGVEWSPVTTHTLDGKTTVYKLIKGAKTSLTIPGREKPLVIKGRAVGSLWEDKTVRNEARQKVGEFRAPGFYPEVAHWMYSQVAAVWKLDNEFAAKWASYAFSNEKSKDLKVVLAAFLLVQSRKGDPVIDQGKVAFFDDDFRSVGEAMALIYDKAKSLDAKLLLRVHRVLSLPQIAQINHELGFGKSARKPTLGRWPALARKWLKYREQNPQLFKGLIEAGYKQTVRKLVCKSNYKPESEKFYETLRWKQTQKSDGRRMLALGMKLSKADTWEDLTEEQICERIVARKPSYKVITGLLPTSIGLTRAIMSAAIEAGSLSDKDLIIHSPTLEDLGLLQVQDIRERWQRALRAADDQRAANIARNVKTKETKDALQTAADVGLQNAVAEVVRNMRIYVFVDISSSMMASIELAKGYLEKFLQAFPLDRIHVGVFNTVGHEVKLKAASQAAVNQAFRGIVASGGTSYAAGVQSLQHYKPKNDEDVLFIFVGDEEDHTPFSRVVQQSGLRPTAFGLVRVPSPDHNRVVRQTAADLRVPCLLLDTKMFDDPYAVPQKLRALIAATPVGVARAEAAPVHRFSLVDTILATKLLEKPAWAA